MDLDTYSSSEKNIQAAQPKHILKLLKYDEMTLRLS